VAVVFFMASAAVALAAPRAGVLHVSATVSTNCIIRSPVGLNFGTYKEFNQDGHALKGKGKVLSIACTKGSTGVRIALDDGRHFSHNHRHMLGPKRHDKVVYEIYTTAKRNVVWNKINTVSYVPVNDQPAAITMYGRVPGKQKPPPGEYSDTLVASVDF